MRSRGSQAAATGNVLVTVGAPVLLAPAVTYLFGARDAAAIYQRLSALILIASPFGAKLVMAVRSHSYHTACTEFLGRAHGPL